MRAMVLSKQGDVTTNPLQLREMPVPVPAPNQVLVEIRVCGVCRTDIHVVEGELPDVRRPLIPGHQAVGIRSNLAAQRGV